MKRNVSVVIFLVIIVVLGVNYASNAEFRELIEFQNEPIENEIGVEIPLTTAIANGIVNLTKVQKVTVDNHIEYVYEGCQYKNPQDGLNKCVVKTVEVIEIIDNNCIIQTIEGFTVDIGQCDAYSGELIFAVYDPAGN